MNYNTPDNDNYASKVDHLVNTMRPPFIPTKVTQSSSNYEAPFDTPAYRNYKELVDNEKAQIDSDDLTEYIYRLGFKIDTLLTKLISQLDKVTEVLEEKSNNQEDSNPWTGG